MGDIIRVLLAGANTALWSTVFLGFNGLALYIVNSYAWMKVGDKAEIYHNSWMPFIPFARDVFKLSIVGEAWWKIFFFGDGVVIGALIIGGLFVIGLIGEAFWLYLAGVLALAYIVMYIMTTLRFLFTFYPEFGFHPSVAVLNILFPIVQTILIWYIAFYNKVVYRESAGSPVIALSSMVRKIRIEGVSGQYRGADFVLEDGDSLLFGRDPKQCNVVFDDNETNKYVSGVHCKIYFDGKSDDIIITDYSTNHTQISDGSILTYNTPTHLRKGLIFSLGDKGNSFKVV